MGQGRWARGTFVVALACIGILSCGGAEMDGPVGTAGSPGGTGRGGTGPTPTATGGAKACGIFEPCGGGPVGGTWSVISECVDLGAYTLIMQQELNCPQAKVTAVEVNPRFSSFTFSGENTYSLLQNITAAITFTMPHSCIGGPSCTDWATVQSLTAGAAYSCDGTTTCTCQETFSDSSSDNGTYSVSGNNIVINSTVTGASSQVGYCIQEGSTIHFITVDPNMHTGPGGQATILRDIVAEKL